MSTLAYIIEGCAICLPLLVGAAFYWFVPRENPEAYLALNDVPRGERVVRTKPRTEILLTLIGIVAGVALGGILAVAQWGLFKGASRFRTDYLFEFRYSQNLDSILITSLPFGLLIGLFATYFYARVRGVYHTQHWLFEEDGRTLRKRSYLFKALPHIGFALGLIACCWNFFHNLAYFRITKQAKIEWSGRFSVTDQSKSIEEVDCVRRFSSYVTDGAKKQSSRDTRDGDIVEIMFTDASATTTFGLSDDPQINDQLIQALKQVGRELPIDYDESAGIKRIWVRTVCLDSAERPSGWVSLEKSAEQIRSLDQEEARRERAKRWASGEALVGYNEGPLEFRQPPKKKQSKQKNQ